MTELVEGSGFEVPGPPADWIQSEDWKSDPFAKAEAEGGYDIDGLKKKNEFHAHQVVGLCIPVFIAGAFLVFAAILVVYMLHLLLPANSRWLSAEEIEHLHNIVFGGAAGAALAGGAKKYLKLD